MKDILIFFLIELNDKGLINNYDFDYEKEAIEFIKKENSEQVKLKKGIAHDEKMMRIFLITGSIGVGMLISGVLGLIHLLTI